jgi:hypothetical protein
MPQAPAKNFDAELKNFRLAQSDIDIADIRIELARNEQAWGIDTKRQESIKCQRETESIFLRGAVSPDPTRRLEDVHPSQETMMARHFPVTMAWMDEAAKALQAELGRALFARLRPKGQVYRHVDGGAYYALRRRYHLVIVSAEGSPMVCGNERIVMHEGELWEFDNKKPHEAFNQSPTPRTHLIFDLLVRM